MLPKKRSVSPRADVPDPAHSQLSGTSAHNRPWGGAVYRAFGYLVTATLWLLACWFVAQLPLVGAAGPYILPVGIAILLLATAVALVVIERHHLHTEAAPASEVAEPDPELSQAAAHFEKMAHLGQMLAKVAHEVNNPLTSIIGHVDLIRLSNDQLPDDLSAMLTSIEQQARRASRLTSSLLSYARQSSTRRSPTQVNDVVRESLALQSDRLENSQIQVDQILTPDLPPVFADAFQLQQVLINLITNAEQALRTAADAHGAERPARLVIKTELIHRPEHLPDLVHISVSDNGPGIPEPIRARIFEPFFTTKADGFGTGLGLAIARDIVNSHGGSIDITSTGDHGTTFTIVLPATMRPLNLIERSSEPFAMVQPSAIAIGETYPVPRPRSKAD